MRSLIQCCVLVFWFVCTAAAQDQVQFTYLTKTHGLSDNNVDCIFKDSDGFMWFGTRNGLCRYDGYEIKIFRKEQKEGSISGNRILDICEDNEGKLWIGTYNDGLNKYDKKTNTFSHYGPEAGIGERVNQIRKFSDGTIWVCSNNGLAEYNASLDTFKLYLPTQNDNSLNSIFVYDILETRTGEVFVATEYDPIQKLNRETQQFETIHYRRHPALGGNYRKHLLEDAKGLIWIAANQHGLCSYNPKTNTSAIYTSFDNNLSTNTLMGAMDIDEDGNLWICTEEEGINIFNPNTKEYTQLKKDKNLNGSLNSDHTYSVYIDEERIVWIGTFDKGINIYNPMRNKFGMSLFAQADLQVLSDKSVLEIFEDSQGAVWVGTDGNGLFRFHKNAPPSHYTIASHPNLISSDIITSIGEDQQGNILVGTYSGGLMVIDPEILKSTIYLPQTGQEGAISSSNVWDILTDSQGRIWLGLLGSGVDRYNVDKKSFIPLGPSSTALNKIDFPNVMVIGEDTDGDIWFGTEGRGIYILDNQTNTVHRVSKDSPFNIGTEGIIKCLKQDQWGQMWIGTEDNGLFMYDKKNNKFTAFSNHATFGVNTIQSIDEDIYGNMWIGTSEGLFLYNPNTDNFNHFITADGLSSSDFNPDAMQQLSDGRIIAGTNNGADIIAIDEIQLNQTLPKIVFTELTVLNKEIDPGVELNGRVILNQNITYTRELNLSWKDKVFTLEFAALNYTLPQKCKFRYKLEGFDEEWINTNANRRFASYSNLPPGQYVFRVLASNNDGKWGDNELTLTIHIKPPFWNTLWFKIALIIWTIFLIYLLYKRRINSHKEHFHQKQIEQENRIIALENEKLEIELKKLAFNIISKNKLLIEQKNRIQNLSAKAKVSVQEGLKKIVDSIDEDLDEEKDWKYIEPQIDKAYNQFITKLKSSHPDLTVTEIRIAAYIRMNLTTKEICEFMNKTQRAVENDRYRLRKKLGLESNDSLQNYLSNI